MRRATARSRRVALAFVAMGVAMLAACSEPDAAPAEPTDQATDLPPRAAPTDASAVRREPSLAGVSATSQASMTLAPRGTRVRPSPTPVRPTATGSTQPRPTPKQLRALSLEELGEVELLRSSRPELDVQVDRAYYVDADAFADVMLEDRDGMQVWYTAIDLPFLTRDDGYRPWASVDGLAVVEISFQDVSSSEGCAGAAMSAPCETIFLPTRSQYAVIYNTHEDQDAAGGFGVDIAPWAMWPEETSRLLVALPPATEPAAVFVRPTPTARPTARLRSVVDLVDDDLPALGPGEVPAALLDTAERWPFVPAARWTYRSIRTAQDAPWSATTLTRTIPSAWRLADDVMAGTGLVAGLEHGSLFGHMERWYLAPGALLGAAFLGHDEAEEIEWIRFVRSEPDLADPAASNLLSSGRLFVLAAEAGKYPARTQERVSIRTPAGRFDDCLVHEMGITTGITWTGWYCPGVGLARSETKGAGGKQKVWEVLDLVDYEIPPLVAVP